MRSLPLLLVLIVFVVADERKTSRREVTIDAAFRYDGDLFFISGDEYMAVGHDGKERYLKIRSGATQVPPGMSIQAAVHWPDKPIVDYYGNETACSSDQTSKTSDISRYEKPREFLQGGGPDAAAYKEHYYYIFKGCQYVRQKAPALYLGKPQNIADIDERLPCDIDAAWTSWNRQEMTILKGDQIWIWIRNSVIGPIPFENRFTIWSWQLKPKTDNRFQL